MKGREVFKNAVREMEDAVRSVTKKPLRVDANEGWKTKEEAVRKINWLESQGVELVEQPLPAPMLEQTRWVRGKVHIPIIADDFVDRPIASLDEHVGAQLFNDSQGRVVVEEDNFIDHFECQ